MIENDFWFSNRIGWLESPNDLPIEEQKNFAAKLADHMSKFEFSYQKS